MKTPVWGVTRDMVLDEAEADRLLAHVEEQTHAAPPAHRTAANLDRVIVDLLLHTGMRCSEFCALERRDWTDAAPGNDRQLVVAGRSANPRTVWLPRGTAARLRAYLQDHRPQQLREGQDAPDAPLIPNERGRRYERTALYRRVVRILTAAGFGARASVQLLRHTYGYLAYRRTGGNLLFVQRQLGHAHPMITAAYARLVDEDYAALADAAAPCSVRVPAGNRREPEVPDRVR